MFLCLPSPEFTAAFRRGVVLTLMCFVALSGGAFPGALSAQTPGVVTDIRPLQSIVARIMQGVGAPETLLPPGSSPHHYAMRPSEARRLQAAEVVFMISPELTPWLPGVIEKLAPAAEVFTMVRVPGTTLLRLRSRDDPDASDPADAHPQPGPDYTGAEWDPHLWLDPENAALWGRFIAETLAGRDPLHSAAYRSNADDFAAEIDALVAGLKAAPDLGPDVRFLSWHDSYQYFESRFETWSAGAIQAGDAARPGAAHLREMQRVIQANNISCVLTEPGYSSGLLDAVFGRQNYHIALADPLGAGIPGGPAMYPQLIRDIAAAFRTCAG